jgi:L-serine dehydratase
VEKISASKILQLDGSLPVTVAMDRTLVFHRRKNLPGHPNGMRFTAETSSGDSIISRIYYSVGGGFVVDESAVDADRIVRDTTVLPHPFKSGTELLRMCSESGLSISALMLENEAVWREPQQVRQDLRSIWDTMHASIERGCEREGLLPGGLKVRRRAASLYRRLQATESRPDPMSYLDWVNLWAIAVNEENAAGGRVVTAPTNGAAGIIPAVLQYFLRFHDAATDRAVSRFLLTAGAIGIIYKTNASISGAEVGCQGEVGVACSMAAAGLAEVLGGTPTQVEDAAEIAMEHNLGLTCDPVGGLVQVPCIERNAMGAVKAINACRLALQGDGSGKVSLDKVIETMRQTGLDMKTKYKETARGGLAVNIIEC